MMRLPFPSFTYDDMLNLCVDGITGNIGLRDKVSKSTALLKSQARDYSASGSNAELYTFAPLPPPLTNDPLVLGRMKKSELIKLYNTYVVKREKPARSVYDSLMLAADEKCPFCGGIGRPRNLDHYLPKTYYPQFSIVPLNLVPSCRDCNMDGKGTGYAANEAEQIIQPYLDADCYFNEQWLDARYLPGVAGEPGVVEYFVSPPEHWRDAQKQRVEKHFEDFDLQLRFSKEAGPRSIVLLAQFEDLLQVPVDRDTAKRIIFQRVIDSSPFTNHWERVMCLALMRDL